MGSVMEYRDNRSQLQREETIQKKRKKRSAKDDDELPHNKKLGSEDGFVFSTRKVIRSASKQQHQQQQHGEGKKQKKPFRWREMTDEELEAHKKKAVESEVTKYKFVKHVRVNRKGGAVASSYFITFQAKDKNAGSQNFQTAVLGRHHNCSGSMPV